jgi:mono/diheme cytochrome c family protein
MLLLGQPGKANTDDKNARQISPDICAPQRRLDFERRESQQRVISRLAGERRRQICVKAPSNDNKDRRERMTGSSRIIASVIVIVLLVGAAAAVAITWRPAIAAIDPPAPQAFDAALVKRGRDLAAIGNCGDCHTVRGAKNFAGGLPVPTPFGTIFSSNITPDAETGIGRWSEAAFRRAMRSGVDREGRHLYPTFPYDHFTHASDEDDRAIYAFLMTRQPVRAPARENLLSFPFNQRPVIAGWKLLYLRGDGYQPDSTKSAEWNRGAYLVEGLAHCGACHTPRNALGAERVSAQFAGGEVDNWHAYAINNQSHAPVPWDADSLFAYLRNGFHPDHGTARGPMAEVVSNLSDVADSDVRAIAVYMAAVSGGPTPDRKRQGEAAVAQAKSQPTPAAQANAAGASIYAAACASCHEAGRPPPFGGVNLGLSTAISAPDSRNLANIVLSGVRAVEGEASPIMPGFAAAMTDAQIAGLLNYLQARFSRQPAWSGVEKTIADARRTETVFLQTSAGPRHAPADPTQRDKP